MTDQLISFETAKLAKEKGFTLPYSEFELIAMYRSEDEGKTAYLSEDELYGNLRRFDYVVPTQPLLQKWLRKEHKIHITVRPICKPTVIKEFYVAEIIGSSINKTGDTYEEALEKGLQEALKLIV